MHTTVDNVTVGSEMWKKRIKNKTLNAFLQTSNVKREPKRHMSISLAIKCGPLAEMSIIIKMLRKGFELEAQL